MHDDWFSLKGKVALVVGASKGLGREIAVALGKAGADIACAARSAAGVTETAHEVSSLGRRSLAISADATREDQVSRMMKEVLEGLGSPNILIYSAGVLESKPTLDLTLEEWYRTIDVNLTGAFLVCRAAGRIMKGAGGGQIILVSSAFGDRVLPSVLPYVVSKGGLNQMVRNLAFEWARYGIRVNGIAPGYFNTEMPAAALQDPALRDAILKRIPVRRVGEPWEIGPLTIYLASTASSYMTGEIIRIDGGQSNSTI